jgi:hypothetical protein
VASVAADDGAPSRLAGGGFEGFESGFYTLLVEGEAKAYTERLTQLCNNPNQYSVHIHEISSEPKTKIPKVFLSFAENARGRREKWATFDYIIEHKVFGDSQASMDEYSVFLKEGVKYGWRILHSLRFYEVDPEMQTSDFRMIVIYARQNRKQDEETPSREGAAREGWVNWNSLVPVKATY